MSCAPFPKFEPRFSQAAQTRQAILLFCTALESSLLLADQNGEHEWRASLRYSGTPLYSRISDAGGAVWRSAGSNKLHQVDCILWREPKNWPQRIETRGGVVTCLSLIAPSRVWCHGESRVPDQSSAHDHEAIPSDEGAQYPPSCHQLLLRVSTTRSPV